MREKVPELIFMTVLLSHSLIKFYSPGGNCYETTLFSEKDFLKKEYSLGLPIDLMKTRSGMVKAMASFIPNEL